MSSHDFVPAPPKVKIVKQPRRIIRESREVGEIINHPDLDGLSFEKQLKKMYLSGTGTLIPKSLFRDRVTQLARRNTQATMGINPKYLLHALDAGDIEDCAKEIYGIDTTQPKVCIDEELTSIAVQEAFEKISDAASNGANIIFASSRPASTLPLFIELARLSTNLGAQVLDSFKDTTPFINDGRKDRRLTWVSSVACVSGANSLLSSDDAKSAEELFFHLPRPDLVVADHIFAGGALTSGYPTVAFIGLESLAVAVASIPEKQVLSVPISIERASNNYQILAQYAKLTF